VLWTTRGERVRTLGSHTDLVRKLVFTRDGTHVVAAGGDEVVSVYAVPSGPPLALTGNTAGVKDIALSGDDHWVASAGLDGSVWVWPIGGGQGRRFLGHAAAVKAVAFTRDGRLVSGAEDDRARIWRLDDVGAPPTGAALRAWLDQQTNLTVAAPHAAE